MKKTFSLAITALCLMTTNSLVAQEKSADSVSVEAHKKDSLIQQSKIPFEGYDLSWINGQNRQTDFPLTLKDKDGETIITGVAYVDSYFNYDFNRPKDNTHTISSAIGRSNEFTINMASIGLETNYKNVIGRLWLQFGQMGSIVQDLDGTVNHGKNTAVSNLKYIREAAGGYHFNVMHGLNVEAGIFMSYIGLESYVLNENWNYQRSLVCDFTPFYFQGARIQAFPSKKFKTELWVMNGWQTYNSWNTGLSIGNSNYYRPNENLQLVANFYLNGKDTRNNPGVRRFHHDNSVVARYYNRKNSKGLSQAAFSLNTHYGFQSGNGVKAKDNYMVGTSLANRLWFNQNKIALSLRGDVISNPGAYLAFSPSPVANNDFNDALAEGKDLKMFQGTATLDYMPNQFCTFRLEYGYRKSNIPYFAGREGTTSPDGWADTPVENWRPDLRKTDSRITVAVIFRL
ncbi:Putative beta-barrel porin-2, OmpL-like. bbp2 [Chryseobacterium arachidis]|uniref:Putative beta-barrel porin-2, OmpL-like. bbp2 n=1 Tax=Chryseobacterium arachidis TaxID=1416778 RepID=A0A1M5BT17_9FLAO|nr:outer membrane beta-barrel protein [Chryseobacterium arachidis]SHF45658.1 Putative beta-barrel porin-2, OmpL-like. bbp2 [Chryseobacterium arachidis]